MCVLYYRLRPPQPSEKGVCCCTCPYVPLKSTPDSPIPFFKLNIFEFSLEISAKLSNVLINCKGNSMANENILQQVHNCIRTKHLSLRTEEAYLQWIQRYILFHHYRHPAEISEKEIRSFLPNLTCDKYVSSSNQHQVSNTIIFYFSPYCINHLGNLAIFCLRSAGVAKRL
jgi:hypothetical protein